MSERFKVTKSEEPVGKTFKNYGATSAENDVELKGKLLDSGTSSASSLSINSQMAGNKGCWAPPNSLNVSNISEELGTSSASSLSINSVEYMEMMPMPPNSASSARGDIASSNAGAVIVPAQPPPQQSGRQQERVNVEVSTTIEMEINLKRFKLAIIVSLCYATTSLLISIGTLLYLF